MLEDTITVEPLIQHLDHSLSLKITVPMQSLEQVDRLLYKHQTRLNCAFLENKQVRVAEAIIHSAGSIRAQWLPWDGNGNKLQVPTIGRLS
jgi:hypothetical protein